MNQWNLEKKNWWKWKLGDLQEFTLKCLEIGQGFNDDGWNTMKLIGWDGEVSEVKQTQLEENMYHKILGNHPIQSS